jgi:response regulator RpfG family c-di-GMP phosphodiesterase
MGAFQAINKITSEGVFTQEDLKHLNLTSTYSGKSIEAAMYLERVEKTQRTAIFMIGQQAESRSRETGNHVRRVAEYCGLIGNYRGLSVQDIELIRLASPMHDAGKVATPDAILKKPGRLTPDEFIIMQQHAQIGYDVLNSSNESIFQTAATIAITHHEKWNGSGYPNKLIGDSIPLFGRITAVADVFDALSNDRCYKKAWPMEKVAQLFREESGQHFDPMLAQILLDHLDEFLQINDEYRDNFTGEDSH